MDPSAPEPLADVLQQAAQRFTAPVNAPVPAFAAPDGALSVDPYDPDGDALDLGQTTLLLLGWTFDTPMSSAVWFDLYPASDGAVVVMNNDHDGDAQALVYVRVPHMADALGAALDALAAALSEGGRLADDVWAGWPTEVEGLHPDVPLDRVAALLRDLSPFPDPMERTLPPEFRGLPGDAPDAAVQAAYAAYFARLLA